MQTFLPYPDFAATAAALDPRRLGKQRVEALQVLRALHRPGYGWRHHPVTKMWSGYDEALVRYGLEICAVWRAGGRSDTVAGTLAAEYGRPVRDQPALVAAGELPPWLGWEPLHRSHRSALLRKDPGYYRARFGDEVGEEIGDDLPYEWPVSDRWRPPGR
jgi:hypothetical protein